MLGSYLCLIKVVSSLGRPYTGSTHGGSSWNPCPSVGTILMYLRWTILFMSEAPCKMATSNSKLSLVKLSQLRDKCNALGLWRKHEGNRCLAWKRCSFRLRWLMRTAVVHKNNACVTFYFQLQRPGTRRSLLVLGIWN